MHYAHCKNELVILAFAKVISGAAE